MSDNDDYSIAIVGMACRFPGARDPDEFWRNLRAGVESITFFSDTELATAGVPASLREHPGFVRASGALGPGDIEMFDAALFGISPRDAELMDPQHRLFMESAWEALESAGYDPDRYRGSIGVFAGAAMSNYLLRNLMSRRDEQPQVDGLNVLFGNDRDSLATRVAYKLNLRGPCYSLQTYCSTSLVAVHVGCQSLLHGECDMALAGGVTLSVPQVAGYLHAEGGLLSPDGHCRAFDAKAQGTPMGSGVGLVLLKPLTAARKDGDTIRAVIRGSAINNDGALKVSFAAPSVEGQAAVIAEALAAAGVQPDSISYVEAHGTATALGDSIEIAALDKAFKRRTARREFCAIGSAKTNIGHLDRAAGVAGLIKTVLSLEHEELPASLHFETPNPQIDFSSTAFFVNAKHRPWDGPRPLRAGVSAFGVGGTNAHVIVEQAQREAQAPSAHREQLLVLSARSATALEAASERLARHLLEYPGQSLADVAFTLQVGRRHFNHRRAVWCMSRAEAALALTGRDPGRVLTGEAEHAPPSNGGSTADTSPRALARMWLAGHTIDWASLHHGERRHRVPLPTYPFERRRFWIDPAPEPMTPGQDSRKKPDVADWFYLPAWRQAPRIEPPRELSRLRWLLIADDGGVADALAEMLRQAGDEAVAVRSDSDILPVLHAETEGPARRVVHLRGLDRASPEQAIEKTFYSLLAIGRALGGSRGDQGVSLDVVTRNVHDVTGEENIWPHHALAIGPCRVLPQEYPSLYCRHVDLAGTEEASPSKVAAELVRELSLDAPESTIALRNGKRWVQQFEPVRLEQKKLPIRPGGVYLVTGGLGGIGLVAAGVLHEGGAASIVVTTRSPFPDPSHWESYLVEHPRDDLVARRIEKLRALRARGANVIVAHTDTVDEARMREVVAETVQRHGALHGVIHAAGIVARDSFRTVQEMSRTDCERHFAPKVHGLVALHRALEGHALDFCMVVSSISSTLGGLGYAAYAAANAFLDAFAQSRRSEEAPWSSVQWSDWKFEAPEAASAPDADADPAEDLMVHTTLAGTEMSPEEGAEALRRALALRDHPILIHSTFSLRGRIARWVEGFAAGQTNPDGAPRAHPRPDLRTPYQECESEPERLIAEVWQQLLGVDRVGRHDNFFELGGNSLIGSQLAERLRRKFGVSVPLRALFEVRTPAEMALLVEELLIDELATQPTPHG